MNGEHDVWAFRRKAKPEPGVGPAEAGLQHHGPPAGSALLEDPGHRAGSRESAAKLERLAVQYHSKGNYDQADSLYHEVLSIRMAAFGPQHLDVASTINNLARLHHDRRDLAQAELLYQRSLLMVQEALGPNHPKLATRLANLAELYTGQGRVGEARECQKRLLALRDALSPSGSRKLAKLQEKWRDSAESTATSDVAATVADFTCRKPKRTAGSTQATRATQAIQVRTEITR